jgi:sugar phosphate isomerase/epimerase
MLRELAGFGFDRVELGHGIRFSLWPEMIRELEKKEIQVTSLHNFCPLPVGFTKANPNCYEFSDPSKRRRDRAGKLTRETISHAADLGASAVVLHLGSTGQKPVTGTLESLLDRGKLGSRKFVELKLKAVREHEAALPAVRDRVTEVLDPVVDHARDKKVKLGFECREEIEEFPIDWLFPELLDRYPEDTVGYWHDFGHAARKDALGFIDHHQHLRELGPRCIGCHIHDFTWPDRDHRLPGKGNIPFRDLLPLIPENALKVLELSPRLEASEVQLCLPWWKELQATDPS